MNLLSLTKITLVCGQLLMMWNTVCLLSRGHLSLSVVARPSFFKQDAKWSWLECKLFISDK